MCSTAWLTGPEMSRYFIVGTRRESFEVSDKGMTISLHAEMIAVMEAILSKKAATG